MKSIIKSIRSIKGSKNVYLLVGTVVSALLIGGSMLYNRQNDNKPAENISETPSTSKIDFSPGTAADQKVADAKKGTRSPANSVATTTVTPIVSYSNQTDNRVIVNAYIPGVVETGGTCTLHASLDSSTLTPAPSVRTFISSNYTSCIQFSIPTSSFPKSGNWSFTVSYSSGKYSGTSQVSSVEVN